jgi:hypothetical protein
VESIAAALYTAALALVGKVGFDLWTRRRERQSIAAGLAGEIGAYLELLNPQQHGQNLRAMAQADTVTRAAMLKAIPSLPTNHPVFDAVAGKLGQLTPDQAKGVSRIYNVVTGMRLLMIGMSSDAFAALPEVIQISKINYIAKIVEDEEPKARLLIADLMAPHGLIESVRDYIGV